jgi:hypothetical protein
MVVDLMCTKVGCVDEADKVTTQVTNSFYRLLVEYYAYVGRGDSDKSVFRRAVFELDAKVAVTSLEKGMSMTFNPSSEPLSSTLS